MHRRALWTLYSGNLLTSIGFWFFLPLLPIFLGRKGGSAALIGAVFAAGLLANAVIRYPAGWAADRFGTRPVLVVALFADAVLFLAYLLPMPLGLFVGLRFLHGAAAGAFWPAANGLLAELTPPDKRGRAFGVMQSMNMAGMLLGPGIGGFIALFNLNAVFVISAVACALGAAALGTLPSVRAEASIEPPVTALRIARALVPLLLLSAGTGYMIGAFDTIWALYMTYRGANTLAVGISFMTFALPAMLLSAQAGALGDRFGPRRLIVAGLVCTATFAVLYPFMTSVPLLIAVGLIEGTFTISGIPSLNAEVSRTAEAGQQGRTQGVFQTGQTVIQIVGALASGVLFTLGPIYAFFSIAAVCFLSVASTLVSKHQRAQPPRGLEARSRP